MHIFSFSRKLSFGTVAVVAILLSVACKKGMYAVVQPQKYAAQRINDISVSLFLARGNVIENRLYAANASRDTVIISATDIKLSAARPFFSLHALRDFHQYLAHRKAVVKELCGQSPYSSICADEADSFFKRFAKSEPFRFGPIPPGENMQGLIVFNLPDPFNTSSEASHIANIVRNHSDSINAVITVHAHKKDTVAEFKFPVSIKVYQDIKSMPLYLSRFL